MNCFQLKDRFGKFRPSVTKLIQAGAFALMFALALPAMAGEARPVKSKMSPVYPEIAKRMRVSGTVKLEASVDAQGKVTDVKEVSGNHTLAVAAKEALLHWKFAPADADSNETVEINFDLGN
jgi:TonB family protein